MPNAQNTSIERIARSNPTLKTPSSSGKFLSPSFPSVVESPSSILDSPQKGLRQTANVSSLQALWLSHRAQSIDDDHATYLMNRQLEGEHKPKSPDDVYEPLSKEEVDGWWQSDNFNNLAAGVISTPSVAAFLRIADTLFPTAYRALHNLLSSKNANANARGLELLFRLHGMLIDRVQHDAPEAIESIADSLRELKDVVTMEVYAAPRIAEAKSRSEKESSSMEGEWKEIS